MTPMAEHAKRSPSAISREYVPKASMTPMGFEPTTPGLRVQYSDRAELRGHVQPNRKVFLNV